MPSESRQICDRGLTDPSAPVHSHSDVTKLQAVTELRIIDEILPQWRMKFVHLILSQNAIK